MKSRRRRRRRRREEGGEEEDKADLKDAEGPGKKISLNEREKVK